MNSGNEVTISTLGSCVVRDIFRICDNDKKFQTVRNVGFISPLSMFKKVEIPIEQLEMQIKECKATGFDKRNALLDLHARAIDYLTEELSDYLIIDMLDIRLQLMKLKDSCVSVRTVQPETKLIKSFLKTKGYKLVSPNEIDELEVTDCLHRMCEEIKKYWSCEKIILVEAYPTKMFRSSEGEIVENYSFEKVFQNSFEKNYGLLHQTNKYVKEELNCRCICMPEMQYVMAAENHTWGGHPVHYTDKVYEWFYNEICTYVLGDSYFSKKRELSLELKNEYYAALRYNKNQSMKALSDEVLECLAIDSFYEYIESLAHVRNCMVIISIKDTVGYWFNSKMQKKLYELGLSENLVKALMVGYIAIIKDGIVIFEMKDRQKASFVGDIDRWNLEVISQPYNNGNISSILLDGEEISLNERGFNIAIFDLLRGEFVDSVSFDTHIPEVKCKRMRNFHSQEDSIRIDIRRLSKKLDDLSKNIVQCFND